MPFWCWGREAKLQGNTKPSHHKTLLAQTPGCVHGARRRQMWPPVWLGKVLSTVRSSQSSVLYSSVRLR